MDKRSKRNIDRQQQLNEVLQRLEEIESSIEGEASSLPSDDTISEPSEEHELLFLLESAHGDVARALECLRRQNGDPAETVERSVDLSNGGGGRIGAGSGRGR